MVSIQVGYRGPLLDPYQGFLAVEICEGFFSLLGILEKLNNQTSKSTNQTRQTNKVPCMLSIKQTGWFELKNPDLPAVFRPGPPTKKPWRLGGPPTRLSVYCR